MSLNSLSLLILDTEQIASVSVKRRGKENKGTKMQFKLYVNLSFGLETHRQFYSSTNMIQITI